MENSIFVKGVVGTNLEKVDEIPIVRRSVRETRGRPALRYSHVREYIRPSKKTRKRTPKRTSVLQTVSAIVHCENSGKSVTANDNIVDPVTHESVACSQNQIHITEHLHLKKNDITTKELVNKDRLEIDALKIEMAELRKQLQNCSVICSKTESVKSDKLHKFVPVTSTPNYDQIESASVFHQTNKGITATEYGASKYLSALDLSDESSSDTQCLEIRPRRSSELLAQLKILQHEYELQCERESKRSLRPEHHDSCRVQMKPSECEQIYQQQLRPQTTLFANNHEEIPQQQRFDQYPQMHRSATTQHTQNDQKYRQTQFNDRHQPTTIPLQPNQPHRHMPFVHQQLVDDNTSGFGQFISRQGSKDLPRFDGNPDDWLLFSSQYYRTTNMCKFSLDENLVRLQRCLHGPAREAVRALLVSPLCVDEIMQTLHERFGRDEYVIKSMINQTRRIAAPKEDNPHTFIEFATAVNNMVVTLKQLNRPDYLQNPQLLEDIEVKLPPMMSMLWSNAVVGLGRYSLDDLNNWIRQQSRSLSLRTMPKDFGEKRKQTQKVYAAIDHHQATTTTITKPFPVKCLCCEQQCLSLAKCPEFEKKTVDDRFKIVRKSFVCFTCLCPGHSSARCKRQWRCKVANCEARHNTLLHKVPFPRSQIVPSNTDSSDESEVCAHIPTVGRGVLLKIIPVELRLGKRKVVIGALLDSGATATLLREDIAIELCATGPVTPLCIQWADGSQRQEDRSQKIDLQISGCYNSARVIPLEGVKTVSRLPLHTQSVDQNHLTNKWPYLRGIPFASYKNLQPGILIGEDHAFVMAPKRVVAYRSNTPIATKTSLGWTVSGKSTSDVESDQSFVYHFCDDVTDLDQLHRLVKTSFTLEDFGVKTDLAKGRSREDERALTLMETTAARIENNRWEVGLLWRDSNVVLPESKSMAMVRLRCLERRLDADESLREVYNEKIDYYIKKNYFVRANIDNDKQQRTWFLPHFPVVNPNKPGKVRIVFDAAAKSHSRSLNDFLMPGPDLLKSLAGVLFRFRQRRVGIVGDIKEMYHRVAIRSEDQSSQLILWRGNDRQREPDIYKMTAMTFGASCSPSAAMYIKDRNAREFQNQFPEACKVIINNHYVDDCLACTDDDDAAIRLVKDICWVHQQGGFDIRNWACSSNAVLQSIPAEKRLTQPKLIVPSEIERVLGLYWDSSSDVFTFRFKHHDILTNRTTPSKRQALRILMTTYDPLGMLAHILIRGKIIMQLVWKSGIGWDDDLSQNLTKMWHDWLGELANIHHIQIPRCYSPGFAKASNIELHIFCDASELAYCAVAYFRIETNNKIETSFVMAKTRVSPLKTSTIPRLELQAALIGSRLATTIAEEHDIKPRRFIMWSDSRTVLSWIRAQDRRFRQFAAQRVGEILEHTDVSDWRWIPSQQNVADDATRITGQINYESTGRWYNGPAFLKLPETEWPQETVIAANDKDLEVIEHVYMTTNSTCLFKFENYSTLRRMVRIMAWVLRFVDRLRMKNQENTFELSAEELGRSETICLKAVQVECFADDIRLIDQGLPVAKNSKLFKLCPRRDGDGLLRVGGRLDLMDASENFKNPIIIDGRHRYSALLIQKYHNRYDHQNDSTVLNELRQKYWIIGARRELKRLKQTCMDCKLRKAKPDQQLMGQLPRMRLEYGVPPFTRTGVDYFGPIEVSVGRRREKRYGVLFTCMSCRAVHIDMAVSLSTDSFLMAWRRFVARRGVPKEIYSDNGTNFRGADAELKRSLQEMDKNAVQAAAANRGVNWNFIPPGSPHFGGCWERLVRSIKNSLTITLKNRRPPSEELLHTLLTEAENVVNSRPLTDLPLDFSGDDVITPNHLLIGRSSADAPIGNFTNSDLILRKQWRASQRLADVFWQTWVRSYLPMLTLRTKWHRLGRKLQVGDVVLVADSNEPRNSWPKGIIERVYPGPDGIIRVVDVRTSSGTSRRPAHKICVLVVADSPTVESDLPSQANTERENVAN